MLEDDEDLAHIFLSAASDSNGSISGELDQRIDNVTTQIEMHARQSDVTRRLQTIPGIGPITASALEAYVGNATQFRAGRQLAAWLGLVPRQHSTGGKPMLLRHQQTW